MKVEDHKVLKKFGVPRFSKYVKSIRESEKKLFKNFTELLKVWSTLELAKRQTSIEILGRKILEEFARRYK